LYLSKPGVLLLLFRILLFLLTIFEFSLFIFSLSWINEFSFSIKVDLFIIKLLISKSSFSFWFNTKEILFFEIKNLIPFSCLAFGLHILCHNSSVINLYSLLLKRLTFKSFIFSNLDWDTVIL
jgi:hypothetical protein